VLGERLGRARIAGIALATAGVLVVVSRGRLGALWTGEEGTIGDVLVLASAVNWAVFTVLSRGRIREEEPARMMLWVMTAGWALTFPWLFSGPGLSELPRLTPGGWVAVLFLGLVCSGAAYVAYYDALRVLSAARVASFIYLQPLVTAAVAVAAGQETLVPAAFVGGALILGGLALVNRSRAGRP
jgi:drug/metabolite transporter (DMT)-like permease